MKLTMDVSDVTRGTRTAIEALHQWRRDFEHRLREAALQERHTHKYRNQTGHLHNSTEAGIISVTDDEIIIDLEMGEDYASHVIRRGYSRFPQIVTRTEADINRMAAALARKLGAL